MTGLEERKRRGSELMKKYRAKSSDDLYTGAADAITDILLFVAQNEHDATQLLHTAEMDFRTAIAGEHFFSEG